MGKYIVYSICIIIVVISLFIIYYYGDTKVNVSFMDCVDGDTMWLKVNGKKEKVRLLGIDAPEIEKEGVKGEEYGEDASKYLCDKLSDADDIVLEYDSNSDKYDKYGRLLAWVFVNDKNMNVDLVSRGYARVRYIYDDYKYVNDLCLEQDNAYNKHIGVWKNDNSYNNNYCIKKKIIDNS